MPRSKRPRARYRPDPRIQAARERRGLFRSRSSKVVDGETVDKPRELVHVPGAGRGPSPRASKFPARYVVPAAAGGAAAGGGAYLLHRRRRNQVVKMINPISGDLVTMEKRDPLADVVGKASGDYDQPSQGRMAAGTLVPGFHGAVAGKPGKKLRAAGNELGGATLGSLAGMSIGLGASRVSSNPKVRAAGALASNALGLGGAAMGTHAAQRKGYFKPQPWMKKEPASKALTPDGMPKLVSTGRGRTQEGPHVSHENRLKVVHHRAKQKPTGTLFVLRRGGRAVNKSATVGQLYSTGSSNRGRRLTYT